MSDMQMLKDSMKSVLRELEYRGYARTTVICNTWESK